MKNIITILFLFTALTISAQSTTVYRNIVNTKATVPASDTMTGKVYTDSSDTEYKTLLYTGTTNLTALFKRGDIGKNGFMWIYIPDSSFVAKVMAVSSVGTDSFSVTLDRRAVGMVNRSAKSINGKVYSYIISNYGGANGVINGAVLPQNTPLYLPYAWINGTGTLWQEPIVINATGTAVFVTEKH